MFPSVLLLVVLAPTIPFVKAACISTARYQGASPTTITPGIASTTAQPDLKPRDVNSICAFYSTWITAWQTSTIACDSGIPCVFQSHGPGTFLGYCSFKDVQVKTEAFDFGSGPASGCSSGQLCCGSANPSWGVYAVNTGSSLTVCGSTRFWRTATAPIAAVEAPTTTTTTTSSSSASATSISSSASATSAQASNNDSSTKLPTATIIGIVFGVLGGIGAFAGGVVAVVRYIKRHPEEDDNKRRSERAELISMSHSGATTSSPSLHIHGPVNVLFRDSEVYLSGGAGGLGSNLRVIGTGGTTRLIKGR